MDDIVQFIKSLGDLHDTTITEMVWFPERKRLDLAVKDLYWNFEGLPEYPGLIGGRFIFSEVSKFFVEADFTAKGLMIYRWLFEKANTSGYSCKIVFSSGSEMLVECRHIECQQNEPKMDNPG